MKEFQETGFSIQSSCLIIAGVKASKTVFILVGAGISHSVEGK